MAKFGSKFIHYQIYSKDPGAGGVNINYLNVFRITFYKNSKCKNFSWLLFAYELNLSRLDIFVRLQLFQLRFMYDSSEVLLYHTNANQNIIHWQSSL